MDSILIQQYVDICILFSNCIHRVQAGGGNISLKEGNKIIIKSSGTALSSTTPTNGYAVCNLAKLHAKFKEENESLENDLEVYNDDDANNVWSYSIGFAEHYK